MVAVVCVHADAFAVVGAEDAVGHPLQIFLGISSPARLRMVHSVKPVGHLFACLMKLHLMVVLQELHFRGSDLPILESEIKL